MSERKVGGFTMCNDCGKPVAYGNLCSCYEEACKKLQIAMAKKCKCGNPATEPHPCPSAVEIYDDESPCNCCEDCEDECAMDI